MKQKITAVLLCLALLLGLAACTTGQPSPQEFNASREAKAWMENAIRTDSLISFSYDGKAFADHIRSWEKSVEEKDGVQVLSYRKDGLTVRTEITFDEARAAYEWCSYYENAGSEKTPLLADLLVMDSVVTVESPVLTTAEGTSNSERDFQPYSVDLTKTPEFSVKTTDGTSSTQAFPYFDISNDSHGVIGAIGWTGNWRLNAVNDGGKIRLQAGQTETRLSVYPGEKLRTPMMVLQFFKGDRDAGHNAWRQLVYANYTPVNDKTGKPYESVPIAINVWGGQSESDMLSAIAQANESGEEWDILWVDAGWYGNRFNPGNDGISWMLERGNWYINRQVLPDGFDNISAALKASGKELMLWMMHETAGQGSELVTQHPTYVFPYTDNQTTILVDYSQEEVLQYMLELVGSALEDAGAEWLRVDFTGALGDMCKAKDARLGDDRVGVTEIQYITNLYRFYDGLKERIPGLTIDNCASGGRRMDLETVRRTLCFWRSDMHAAIGSGKGNADATRNQAANTFYWLPLTTSGWSDDGANSTYGFRSIFSSGFSFFTASDPLWYKEMMKEFAVTREMMYKGDYYILASGVSEAYDTVLAVYEFYIPEEGRGMIEAFRPENCNKESGVFVLKGLDPSATYELEVVDNGQKLTMTGEKLMTTGLAIEFPSPNLSLMIYINKK